MSLAMKNARDQGWGIQIYMTTSHRGKTPYKEKPGYSPTKIHISNKPLVTKQIWENNMDNIVVYKYA